MTFKVKIFKVSNTYFLVAGGGSTSPGFVYLVALTGLCPILGPKNFKVAFSILYLQYFTRTNCGMSSANLIKMKFEFGIFVIIFNIFFQLLKNKAKGEFVLANVMKPTKC